MAFRWDRLASATLKTSHLFLLPAAFGLTLCLASCNLIAPLANALLPLAGAKLMFSCMPEHALVDTPSGPRRAQSLTAGETVIGYSGRPVKILQKHIYQEDPATEFFKLSFSGGAEVEVCGMHRVAGVRARSLKTGDVIAGRTITGISRHSGETRSCDLLTEDVGYRMGGVPVNSMIEEMRRASARKIGAR